MVLWYLLYLHASLLFIIFLKLKFKISLKHHVLFRDLSLTYG